MDYDRELVNYWELSEEWQAEARSNHDDYEDQIYIMPLDGQTPEKHVLWDLSECVRSGPNSGFDGVIGISNNSAVGINISPDGSMCKMTFI